VVFEVTDDLKVFPIFQLSPDVEEGFRAAGRGWGNV
jgi:hypothetical protein